MLSRHSTKNDCCYYSHWTSLTRCQTTGAAHSYFMNVWSLETRPSPLTAIEVIPVLPEFLRSFLTKYKQVKTARIVLAFRWQAVTDQFLYTCASVRAIFHLAEFSARNDIFFCLLTPTLCQLVFKQNKMSLRAENSA